MPACPTPATGVGIRLPARVGAGVWIEFEGGDVSYPIWVGCYWRDGEKPADATPTVKAIVTAGHKLLFDDDAKTITLTDANDNTVTLDLGRHHAAARRQQGRGQRQQGQRQRRRAGGDVMLHAPAGEAQTEGSKKPSDPLVSLQQTATAGLMPRIPGNQARLRMLASGPAVQRPGRVPALQTKAEAGAAAPARASEARAPDVPPVVGDVLRSPGRPLDAHARTSMERSLRHNFAEVRVHTDGQAAQSADSVGALAYTVGNQIVFSGGMYQPESQAGRRLIAHELVHVVQQGGQDRRPPSALSIDPHPSSEHEADRAAERVAQGMPAGPLGSGTAPASLQRQTPAPAPAPAPAAATGAFASETPDMKTRRLEAIAAARTAITRIAKGMQGGYLWSGEVVSPQGNITLPTTYPNVNETKAQRDTRLQGLRADLVVLIQTLESGPILPAWLAPQANFPATATKGGTSMVSVASSQPYVDVTMFYAIHAAELGAIPMLSSSIGIISKPTRFRKRPLRRRQSATLLRPALRSWSKTPRTSRSRRAWPGRMTAPPMRLQLYSLWKDDLGYFYIYNNARHYLKDRPVNY